jgi:ClpP class serine protease
MTCAANHSAGADALAHGLVDKLGGLQDAVVLARQEAKLSEEVCNAAEKGGTA